MNEVLSNIEKVIPQATEAATCGVFIVTVILLTMAVWCVNEFRNKV